MSVSIAEEEVRGIGASVLDGHYTAWNYYQTTDTPENKKFVEAYKAKYGKDRVTDDPIEAGYTAVYLWAAAVKKAGSFDVEKVKAAAKGIEFNAPEGKVVIDGENQHISKTARIGQITADGQIKEIWNSGQPLKPDPFLKTYPWGGRSNEKIKLVIESQDCLTQSWISPNIRIYMFHTISRLYFWINAPSSKKDGADVYFVYLGLYWEGLS